MNTRLTKAELERAAKITGDAIREARENQFMTLYTAAKLSGMEVSEQEDLEAGRLDPDFVSVLVLCKALELDAAALFERALTECRQEPPGATSS